jgi:hypothetical protein
MCTKVRERANRKLDFIVEMNKIVSIQLKVLTHKYILHTHACVICVKVSI